MAQVSKQKRSPTRKLHIHMRTSFRGKVPEKKKDHRTRLRMSLNPIPTMYPEPLVKDMPSVLPNLTPLQKAPTKRTFSPDEINSTSYKNLEVKD